MILSRRILRRTLAMLAVAGFAGSCRSGPDVTQGPPDSIEASTMVSIDGIAAAAVNPAPAVVVRDRAGRPVRGVLVYWSVLSGGGSVARDTSRTNASGVAASGGWTLGTLIGEQELEALVVAVGTVRFVAHAHTGALARLVRLSPDAQVATVGQPVASPPSVRAEDAFGNPVADVNVMFSIVSGSGTIVGVQKVTNANGIATADAWILGIGRGQQVARAIADGGASIVFSATAVSGAPVAIQSVSGNNQQGIPGIPLVLPLTVRVVDAFENPVSDVTLIAIPAPNSGLVTPNAITTNQNGLASFSWTPGSEGAQSVTITSAAIPGASATFVATLIANDFAITVRYIDFTPSARQQLAVERAVAKFRSIIVGGNGVSQVTLPSKACGRDWFPALNEVVSGMLILARIGFIDGTGGSPNVVGNASICAVHATSGLPVLGSLLLDSDDLGTLEANGLVDAVVLHEIGHTLGIGGQLWTPFLSSGCPANDPFFSGAAANAQFNLVGGTSYIGNKVPVENTGGEGSTCAHWRESVLDREIMTSQLDAGTNPFSVISVGSLQDIGYLVSYVNADPFQLFASPFVLQSGPVVDLRNDLLPTPPLPKGAVIRELVPGRRRAR